MRVINSSLSKGKVSKVINNEASKMKARFTDLSTKLKASLRQKKKKTTILLVSFDREYLGSLDVHRWDEKLN